jgi:CheY-like chemotaxis protein
MARIVLVEDNPHNQAVFMAALRRLPHAVELIADGAAAIASATADPPDLMLLDLSLPQVDGWTVVRALRGADDPRLKSLTIVALTAHAMKGDRERAIDAGCDAYLSKPVSPRELIRRVEELLAGSAAA